MPDPKKLQWKQLKVGILALVAMTISGILILLLTGNGNPFAGSFTLRTYMADSAGMGVPCAAARVHGAPPIGSEHHRTVAQLAPGWKGSHPPEHKHSHVQGNHQQPMISNVSTEPRSEHARNACHDEHASCARK